MPELSPTHLPVCTTHKKCCQLDWGWKLCVISWKIKVGQLTWQQYHGKEAGNLVSLKLIACFHALTCQENHHFQNVIKFIPIRYIKRWHLGINGEVLKEKCDPVLTCAKQIYNSYVQYLTKPMHFKQRGMSV